MVELISVFGLVGSVCASLLFFPQVWKSYKSKHTKDLSWFGIIVGLVNGIAWLSYGILKGDPFIYVTNAFFFTGVFLLFVLKKMYG